MTTVRRGAIGALAALLVAVSVTAPAAAEAVIEPGVVAPPQALSPWDAQLYAAAFDAVRRGDFASADAKARQVNDRSLLGFLEFQKLFHPTAYTATYEELVSWLERYGDLAPAQRVFTLALRRKPAGAPDPVMPGARQAQRTWSEVEEISAAAPTVEVPPPPPPKAAREALNNGQLETALRLAVDTGENWVAGLAAWRLGRYADAYRYFEAVTVDVTEDPWIRSGGAYWTARSAMAMGRPEKSIEFLRIAAQYPYTFYGVIAERQLGLEPEIRTGPQPYLPGTMLVRTSTATAEVDGAAVQSFIRSEPRARLAVALAQVGQYVDAGQELSAGLRQATDEATKAQWTNLAMALNPLLAKGRANGVDGRDYPAPELQPQGGFTLDRALVYALVRKESRFNPSAKSSVGAYGLMQVMPATAAWMTGDADLRKNPDRLLDPALNLRLGQDYLAYLLGQGSVSGDMMRMIAAFNGGPGPVLRTHRQLGDVDALLFIESIPVPQTRAYVEDVMASYWIYRRLFGQDVSSLDLVVRGAAIVPPDQPPARADGVSLLRVELAPR